MSAPGFWDDQEKARETITEANRVKGWVEPWNELHSKVGDLKALADLLAEEEDEELLAEWEKGLATLTAGVETLELRTMLQGEYDHREALVTIHPGAGGTESADWAEMLIRMYTRWAERHSFEVNVLDLQPGEEAGVKSATLEIKGESAHLALRLPGPAPHIVCQRLRVPAGRGRHRDRDR